MSELAINNTTCPRSRKSCSTIRHSLPSREAARKKFICSEESESYARALQHLLFNRLHAACAVPAIVEFGSGTGEPVLAAILNSGFNGAVHGYEINPDAAAAAFQLISSVGLERQYVIHTESFFDIGEVRQADYLIANPPYVPADDPDDLILPSLCGGSQGDTITKRILAAGYANVCLEVSSYANPASVIQHAQDLGYRLTRFLINQLPLGIYSRQPIVMNRIRRMQTEGCAFLSDDHYSVGSAYFTKRPGNEADLSYDFFVALTSNYVRPRQSWPRIAGGIHSRCVAGVAASASR